VGEDLGILWEAPGELGVGMCTYVTEHVQIIGSGKGSNGWFKLSEASVYFDHPVHVPLEHSLNIDFLQPELGPSARVAVELDVNSARRLAEAILSTISQAPLELAVED